MLSTLHVIFQTPEKGGLMSNGFLHRYHLLEAGDGLGSIAGTFNICTFWLVEALSRAGKAKPDPMREGCIYFEKILGFSNYLSFFAKETRASGEALGNFPQAFT